MTETETTLFPLVYCPGCKETVRYNVEELPPKSESDPKVQDVVCPQCFYIIATFHERDDAIGTNKSTSKECNAT